MQSLDQLREAPCFGKGEFYEKHAELLENTLRMKNLDHNESDVINTAVKCEVLYNNDYQPCFKLPYGKESKYATNLKLSMPRKYWRKLKMIRYVEGNCVVSQYWANKSEDIDLFNELLDNKVPTSLPSDGSLFSLWGPNENEVIEKNIPLGILKVMKYLPLNNRGKTIELEFLNDFEFELDSVNLTYDVVSSINGEELNRGDFYILGFEKISVNDLKSNFNIKASFNFPTFYLLFENNISKKNMKITLDNELVLQPSLLNEESKKLNDYYIVSLANNEDFGNFKGLNFGEVKNIVISSNTKHSNNLNLLAINVRRMSYNGYGLEFVDHP